MFTGLIEARGTVLSIARGITVETGMSGLGRGVSLAIDGVCLTVAEVDGGRARFDVSRETMARTTAGAYRPGSAVNLERPLAFGGRLDGHFVTGHVDCTGLITRGGAQGEREIEISYPEEFDPLVVRKGSVAVSGISLTTAWAASGRFGVALIPETLEKTTAGSWKPGDRVNLEFDLVGKYILRRMELDGRGARLKEYLEKSRDSVG